MNVSLTLLLGRIFKLILFISFVFVAVPQLSLAVVRGGYSLVAVRGFLMAMASHGDGFSWRWLLLLWSVGSRACELSSGGARA